MAPAGGAEAVTLSLFRDEGPEKRRRLEEVVLKIGDRFGGQGLTRASLLEGDEPSRGRRPQR